MNVQVTKSYSDPELPYKRLYKILSTILCKLPSNFAYRLCTTFIYAMLDWDIPPSYIENAVNDYLEELYDERKSNETGTA